MTNMQVECFLAVAKHLNFTEAASQLFIAQSSLSRNVSNLEDELGVQLFVRTKKYVRLTPAGAVLYKEFSRMMQEIKTAVDIAKQANLGKEGTLRIGVIETQRSDTFLPQSLGIIHKDYPGINFTMSRYNFEELRQALKDDEIDICLTLSFDYPAYEKEMDVVYQNFLENKPQCVISAHHPAAKNLKKFEDLKDVDLIAINPEVSKAAFSNAFDLCQHYNYTPNRIRYANNLQDLTLMVEAGMGFTILDDNSIFNLNPVVKAIDVPPIEPLALIAVWKRDNLNPTIPLFVNILIDSSSIVPRD